MAKATEFWKEAEKETKIGFKLFHLERIVKILPINNKHTRDMPGAMELATKTLKLMSELAFREGFIEPTIVFSSQVLQVDPQSWKAHYFLSRMNFLKRCRTDNCPNGENCS